jgi:ketosteroid isomerase-like protein
MSTLSIETAMAGVQSVLDNWVTSVENGDMPLLAQTVAHDPDLVYFGISASDRVVGWDTLKAGMEAQNAALSDINIVVSDITINLSPDRQFAWATSLWDFNATMAGQALQFPVRCSWVLEQRDERWVLVHFHKSVGMET